MKNKILMLMIATIFLLASINFVQAEMRIFGDVLVNPATSVYGYNNSIVRQHAFITFEDTSLSGIGKHKPIEILVRQQLQDLPYNLSFYNYSGQVTWCNFTIRQTHFIYDKEGNIVNTTTYFLNVLYANISAFANETTFEMADRDSAIIDMDCYYTDQNYLYVGSVLFGSFSITTPSYECDECRSYTYEQLANEIAISENLTQQQSGFYQTIGSLMGYNIRVWLTIYWLFKIFVVLFGIGLVFGIGFWIYNLIKNLAR